MPYTSFDPETEISGRIIQGFIESLNQSSFLPILKEHKLDQAEASEWYPLQNWLNVLNAIEEGDNSMFDFVSIGLALGSRFPADSPEYDGKPIATILQLSVESSIQSHFRNGDAGWVKVDQPEEHHIVLFVRVPFPSDLIYGSAYGVLRKLAIPNFEVVYDPDAPRLEDGGEATVLHIKW